MSPPTLPSLSSSGASNGDLDGAVTTQNIRERVRLTRSSIDILSVMSYAPAQGKEGSPIFVNFTCKADIGAIGVHIRLVVGRRAVSTQVREMAPTGYGRWQLEGSAPSFSKQRFPSVIVPLTIQAVDRENKILDSVTFGDFTYEDTGPRPRTFSANSNTRPSVTVPIPSGTDSSDRSLKRQSPYSRPPTPASSDSEPVSSSQPRKSSGRFQTQASTTQGVLRRIRPIPGFSDDNTQSATLDIMTPLDNLCYNWDESELQAGRRLVRFWRVQDRNRLMISAEPISQADYDPNDIVISCIYREETDSCCVTSVDIIHLLQRLVDADFEVDEKNRIRRNLEGLRPTTISKTRPGFESFFQRIMDFPDPKPRKIEKDLKVFDWKLLPQALEKIVSKYVSLAKLVDYRR
ncbi:hypothetical protein F5I97DRAFT_1803429 [Phlebopus sp. FC_14]|nr:hypothetical protein F5I97DRAFT_1803429 [Phlebopus sp. FC_14]